MGLTRQVRKAALALLLATGGAAIAPAPVAEATTIAPLTEEQLTDASTYIVRGVVREVWPEVDDSGVIWTRARVQVEHTFKGPDKPGELVVDTIGGRLDDYVAYPPSAARFSEGEQVLLFLAPVSFGARLTPVAMYLGKLTIRRAPGDTRQHAMRWQAREHGHYDHRFLPHPAPERRLYLDDLLERVETRLDAGWTGEPIPGVSREQLIEINQPERRFRR